MPKQKQEQEAPRMLDGLKVEARDWKTRISGFETELVAARAEVEEVTKARSKLLLPANTGDETAAFELRSMQGRAHDARMRVDDLGECIEQAQASLARIEREIFEAEHTERYLRRSQNVRAALVAMKKAETHLAGYRVDAAEAAAYMNDVYGDCHHSEAERIDRENATNACKHVLADACAWAFKGQVPDGVIQGQLGGPDAAKLHDKLHERVSAMLVNADEARERARNVQPPQHHAEQVAQLEEAGELRDVSAN